MKLLLCVLLVLGLQAVTGFGVIKKCTVPKRLEGKFKVKLEMGGNVIGTGEGTLHADDTVRRGVISERVFVMGQTTKVNIFIHSRSQLAYYAMPTMGMCLRKPMKMPLLPGRLPKGVYLRVRRSKLDGVPVQIWDVRANQDTTGLEAAHIYLIEDNCMPVKMEFTMSLNGLRVRATENWYDMKEGVEEDSVFRLPGYCAKKKSLVYGNGGANRLDKTHDWHLHHAMARHEAHSHVFN